MTIEDRLRSAMVAGDTQAPTQLPWPPAAGLPPHRRRPSRGAALAALAVVALLLVGAAWLAVGSPRTADRSAPTDPGALSCPTERIDTAATSVPAAATIPKADTGLVPERTPATVVVCAYQQVSASGGPSAVSAPVRTLTDAAQLGGDLSPVVGALAYLPATPAASTRNSEPACPLSAGVDFLLGLTYADGTVWVSAPSGACAGAGNGAFTTVDNVSADAQAWLTAGRWVKPAASPDQTSSACPATAGRLGQDTALVPDTPTALTICVVAGVVATPHRVSAADLGQVLVLLRALPATRPPSGRTACGSEPSYRLEFAYQAGPALQISLGPQCSPSLDNGALQAISSPDLTALVQQLTR